MTDPAAHPVAAAATARRPSGPRSRPIRLPAAPSTKDLQQQPELGVREEAVFWALFPVFYALCFRKLSEKTLRVPVGAMQLRKPTSCFACLTGEEQRAKLQSLSLGAGLLSLCCTRGAPGVGRTQSKALGMLEEMGRGCRSLRGSCSALLSCQKRPGHEALREGAGVSLGSAVVLLPFQENWAMGKESACATTLCRAGDG